MDGVIIPVILMVVLCVFGITFMVVTSRQSKKNSINKDGKGKNGENGENVNNSKSDKKTKKEDIPKEDMFKFMEFDRILDNMIVQNNGSKFTMAVKCKGINYDLMSEVERLSIEEGFITFLNTLRFPIQLYVQAQNIDLKKNVQLYNERVESIKDEYETANMKYNEIIDQLDSTSDEINNSEMEKKSVQNVLEYANDIIRYVEKLSINKNLLQRNFYILFSYHTSEITSGDKFTKEEIIDICFNELYTRAQGIISSLSACSVNSYLLDSNQIAELLYSSYDRDDSNIMNLRQALESGYYRLYSTSHDAFQRKTELIDSQIAEQAQIRAYEALKKSIQEGTFVAQEVTENQVDEEISKKAIDVVKAQKVNLKIKEKAKDIIIEDYKNNKQKRVESLNAKLEKTISEKSEKVKEDIKEIKNEQNTDENKKVEVGNVEEKDAINNIEAKEAVKSAQKISVNKEKPVQVDFEESGLRSANREVIDTGNTVQKVQENPKQNDIKSKSNSSETTSNSDEDELII